MNKSNLCTVTKKGGKFLKKLPKFVFIAFAALMLAGAAHALPIAGDIGIIGYGLPAIDTLTATAIPTPVFAVVSVPTGDFDSFLNPGDQVNYNGFTFDPAPSPVADPLWTAGGFSFVLDSIIVSFRDEDQIVFDGVGTITGNGFDATNGSWTMTVDAQSTSFNFSNGTTAPVPEPATMFLLGTGLIGLAGFGRKKLKK
jgi:hypothetical protein